VLGQYPVSCLAEEVMTPGDGRIRGLISVAGNPDRDARRLFIERHFPSLKGDSLAGVLAAHTEGYSMAYLKELCLCASLLAIERGLDHPGEAEIMASLQTLSVQISGAKKDFILSVKTVGF